MVSLIRLFFNGKRSLYVPAIKAEYILEQMAAEVPESNRRTFRVSEGVHESWKKYSDRLKVNQYLCLVTNTYEVCSELVEAYQKGEIDEIEFTKAIAGERDKHD